MTIYKEWWVYLSHKSQLQSKVQPLYWLKGCYLKLSLSNKIFHRQSFNKTHSDLWGWALGIKKNWTHRKRAMVCVLLNPASCNEIYIQTVQEVISKKSTSHFVRIYNHVTQAYNRYCRTLKTEVWKRSNQ